MLNEKKIISAQNLVLFDTQDFYQFRFDSSEIAANTTKPWSEKSVGNAYEVSLDLVRKMEIIYAEAIVENEASGEMELDV